MKTEYQARHSNGEKTPWNPDPKAFSNPPTWETLWRRQSETPEEAAVRQMEWLNKWALQPFFQYLPKCQSETAAEWVDRNCPPPPATEVQVDWDTLEPVKEVPVFFVDGRNVWIAGQSEESWIRETTVATYHKLLGCQIAIGATRESALRNLRELQEARAGK